MSADRVQLLVLKDLLHKFYLSNGLKINYNKSWIIPINVHPDQIISRGWKGSSLQGAGKEAHLWFLGWKGSSLQVQSFYLTGLDCNL
jgi:hypothetical protein